MKFILAILVSFLLFSCNEEDVRNMKMYEAIEVADSVLDYSNIEAGSDGYAEWDGNFQVENRLAITSHIQGLQVFDIDSTTGKLSYSHTVQQNNESNLENLHNLGLASVRDGLFLVYSDTDPENHYDPIFTSNRLLAEEYIEHSNGISTVLGLASENSISYNDDLMVAIRRENHHGAFFLLSNEGIFNQVAIPRQLQNAPLRSVAISETGVFVAVAIRGHGGQSAPLRIYKRNRANNSLTLIKTIIPAFTVSCMKFIGDQFVYIDADSLIFLTVPDFDALKTVDITHSGKNVVELSPDENFLAVGRWDTSTGNHVILLERDIVNHWVICNTPTDQPDSYPISFAWDDTSTYLYVTYYLGSVFVYKRTSSALAEVATPFLSGSVGWGNDVVALPLMYYRLGNLVYSGDSLFESVVDNNNASPDSSQNDFPWLNVGKINRWRMFDEFSDSYTVGSEDIEDGDIVVRLKADDIHTLYLGGLTATFVTVKRLRYDLVVQWEETFGVIGKSKKIIPLDSATADDGMVEIRISNSGIPASISVCQLLKSPVELGKTEYGIENLPLDGSRMVTDDFLRTYLRQGRKADIIKASVRVEWSDYDMVGRELNKARAKKYLWDFNGDSTSFESLFVYGFMIGAPRRALNGYNDTTLRIEIQEFT